MFDAIVIDDPDQSAHITTLDESSLPDAAVRVDIEYSTLNYKDALALTSAALIVKSFPMIAGIDLAARVIESRDPRFAVGDRVVATGNGLGESYWGGMAQRAALPGAWLVPLPAEITTHQAMAIGTAGFTAMLSVMALAEHGIATGDVLVTGAAGGVGSFATALLAQRGYRVIASTGRRAEEPYLRALGAHEVIDRAELTQPPQLLGPDRWSAAIDTVGGTTLASACASTRYGGIVAACGMAGGLDLPASVLPFILRAVTLAGIDSVYAPRHRRVTAWQHLADELRPETLESITATIPLTAVIATAGDLLSGQVRGRLVVDTHA